ncbi:hypothetical protein LTR53_020112, partial [Teratosphaeriaceae sp. CCFEE 6253]
MLLANGGRNENAIFGPFAAANDCEVVDDPSKRPGFHRSGIERSNDAKWLDAALVFGYAPRPDGTIPATTHQ